MAQTATNKGKYLFATGGIVPGTTDLRMGLLKTLTAHTNVPEINFISDMEAHADFAEVTASGYARVALPGETVTENDGASDYASIHMDAVVFAAIQAGETIVGAFIYKYNAADSAAEVIAVYDVSPTIPTNGSTVTINAGDFARIA
jgi:hypothetical protein